MHVVVVGGGIVGFSCAYYLREAGVSVTVIEQDHIGAGSTPKAGGGIRSQFSTPVSIALSQLSIREWERFDTQFGVDIAYRRHGYLYLTADEQTRQDLDALVSFHNDHGVPSTFVEPSDLESYSQDVRSKQFIGGTYCPTDGYANPTRALHGYAFGAASAGADIILGERVAAIERRDDGVSAVRTPQQTLEGDVVVNAAGAWAGEVATLVDVDLEITPDRRQLLVLRPDTPVDQTGPFVTDLDRSVYYRPDSPETMYAGGHVATESTRVSPDQFSVTYDTEWATRVREELADVSMLITSDTPIERGWAGLYAMTPDHHPIIDEVIPGFVVAAGFSGHGFMQAPATGQLVAKLVTDQPLPIDISQLTADRFETGNTLDEVFYSA